MRYLPGQPNDIAHESITSYSLMSHAIADPDILPTVFSLFEEDYSPITSILNAKGMKSRGLFDNMKSNSYTVVKSNVVQYPIKNSKHRKSRVVRFVSDAYPNQPGFQLTPFQLVLDNNWPGPKEVIELADNMTKLYVYSDQIPTEVVDGFLYNVKLITKDRERFVDPALLAAEMECSAVYTMYEQDFSETGTEKYTFDGWGRAYMTLQRLKYSYSGTAAAMGEGKKWTMHNGQKTYLTHAEDEMMRRAAKYHEYALVFGEGTVSIDGEVLMKDSKGREIMSGDGILHSGDGAYEYPYPSWSMPFLENLLSDVDVRSGREGKKEVILVGGKQCINGFSRLMAANGFRTQNNNVVGDGSEKGVNNDYSFYEFGGVRIIAKNYRFFDAEERPSMYLPDGTKRSSHDGIILPLGLDENGNNQIELIQLRPMKTGTVSGIDKGGEMATSIDGSHKHVLFQTGVISRTKISRIFRPIA
jgi:hypothetical protein